MSTLLRCPACNALLRIHEEHLGKAVRCPKCDLVISTRAESEPDAPPLPETRIETPTKVENRSRPKPASASQVAPPEPGQSSDALVTARRSISIPLEIFRQMARETTVDWNKVACTAIEQKLAEIEKLAETAHLAETMRLPDAPQSTPAQKSAAQKDAAQPAAEFADVIQRLRSSKNAMQSKGYPEGLAAGREWARSQAAAADLIALERFRDSVLDREWNTFFEFNNTIYTYAEALIMGIHPHITDVSGAKRFWLEALGENRDNDLDNPIFLKAFAEGALQIWISVKDAL